MHAAPRTGRLRRMVLAMALLALAGGCTSLREYVDNGFKVGPNYRRPAAPVAQDWIDAADLKDRPTGDDVRYWWMVFRDPTLDALMVDALRQNLTLREAGFRVLQFRAARAIAAGRLFPQQQSVDADFNRFALSGLTANNQFIPQRFYDQFDVGFNLAWELDFWGRFRRALEAADADLDASVEEYDAVLVTLLGDMAATWVEIRTLQRRIALVQTNVRLQRQTYTIANARFKGGQVSSLDVDQALSTLEQTEALVPQYEIQLRQAVNRLCILLGVPPEDLLKRIANGPIPVAPPGAAVGMPADLLRRRPDVRRAERLVASQSARLGVTISELYPHIGVNGTLGYSAQNFSDLLKSEALAGTVGPYFQWNVLHYGRLLNDVRLHDARLAEFIVAYQNSVLNANKEVEDGIAQFLGSQRMAKHLAVSVEASERATNVALVQYRSGMVDFNRVSLIEQNLVQQQDLEAQAQGEIALGLVEIYRALGGGWEIRLDPNPGSGQIPPPGEPVGPGQPRQPPSNVPLERPDQRGPMLLPAPEQGGAGGSSSFYRRQPVPREESVLRQAMLQPPPPLTASRGASRQNEAPLVLPTVVIPSR